MKPLSALAAILLLVCTSFAEDTGGPYLEIENRTGRLLQDIKLASGESFADLSPGLRTYGSKVSAVSVQSNVLAACDGKEVVFRCYRPIEERPKTGSITCVLTETAGEFEANYIPTPLAEYLCGLPEKRITSPDQIAVAGMARRPGFFQPDPETPLTLEQALELAGGLHDGDYFHTPAASAKNIVLLREVNGILVRYNLDARNSKKTKGKDLGFPVLPGDAIYVPFYF